MKIETIYFVEDTDDEVWLSRLHFKYQKINVALERQRDFEELAVALAARDALTGLGILVVIDLNLTVTTGIEVLRDIRSHPVFNGLIAGICTGSEDPADEKNAREAGADFFIGKPLELKSLLQICDRIDGLSLEENSSGSFDLLLAD